ncbi:RusA family crossover junction endodeoxyribonuclease [Endozoicomonas sp. ALB115]|uniref:RusA family crossover junction endodeoxyribonuclease n=1 Tax=Endozoicomonas sp. ALB115 TaxID=3403074 RepID=UPI003BB6B9C1
MRISLPLPPTVNHVWKHRVIRKGHKHIPSVYMSEAGKEYRRRVQVACTEQGVHNRKLAGSLRVIVRLHFPTNHRSDIDNRMKALLDGLTHAGVWIDDSQIDQLVVMRGQKLPPEGIALVEVMPMTSGDPRHAER